jgi:uncharacterized membrane protein YfcA
MTAGLVAELIALGLVGGFLAGLLGIGGGMLMVPVLTFILGQRGVEPGLAVKMAIATSMATIVFTSLSSVRAHHRRGAVRWDLVKGLAPGILAGGLLAGAGLFALLKGAWLALVFAAFVSFSGWQMLRNKRPAPSRQMPGPAGQFGAGAGIGLLSGLVGASGGSAPVAASSACPSWSGATCRCIWRSPRARHWAFRSRWPTRSAMSSAAGACRRRCRAPSATSICPPWH